MIETGYVRMMARYNAWQNKQLARIVEPLDADVLSKDRGAFFGSIHSTLNHVLWGDTLWMSRFDPSVAAPKIEAKDNTTLTPTISVWSAERYHLDGKIRYWADSLSNIGLRGNLTWYSGVAKADITKPLGLLIPGFFNHQTHHRGQVHAMLTAAGLEAPVTDLFLMPEEGA